MTRYVDLHVFPKADNEETCQRTAQMLRTACYSTVGLTVPTGLLRDRVKTLRQIFEGKGVRTVLRIDLSPTSRAELLRALRRFRSQYDVIAVKCLNARVATVACRDRRVDIVFFDPMNRNVKFSHSLSRLLRGAVEFNLVSALLGQTNSGVFSRVSRAIAIAREHKVKVVLSSGAQHPDMIRSPLQISGLGSTLGLSTKEAAEGVSSIPLSIVAENLKKRRPEYIEEGVTIVVPSRR